MVNTLFSWASSFVSMNNSLSPHIHLHRLIRQGHPLSLYLYVLIVDALGYLLEASLHKGKNTRVSLPRGKDMVNNNFVDDSLLGKILRIHTYLKVYKTWRILLILKIETTKYLMILF